MKSTKVNTYDPAAAAHIEPAAAIDPEIFALLIKFCPAGLYWLDEQGAQHYNYRDCLECGACRILAGEENFRKWDLPEGGKGVDYR